MKDENVLKEKESDSNCNCIFCQSKCSECGSKHVNVRFKPEFEYSFEEGENTIDISYDYYLIELHCQDCDHHEETYHSPLVSFISKCLELPSGVYVTRNKDKKVEIKQYICS